MEIPDVDTVAILASGEFISQVPRVRPAGVHPHSLLISVL